jgi:integrase
MSGTYGNIEAPIFLPARGGLFMTSTSSSKSRAKSSSTKDVDLSSLSEEVAQAVRTYQPEDPGSLWAKHSPLLVQLLIQIAPATAHSAKMSLRSMFGLVNFRILRGYYVNTIDDFLTADIVETYIAHRRANPGKVTANKKQIRGVAIIDSEASHLRAIGRILNPTSNWPVQHQAGKARPLQPIYSDAEITEYFEFAVRISDPRKKRIALCAMSLSLGAGLTAGQLHHVRVEDIVRDEEEVTWVKLGKGTTSRSERLVPVASPWDSRLWAGLAVPSKRFNEWALPMGRNVNAMADNLLSLSFGKKHGPISVDRMRHTWLIHRLMAGAWPTTLAHYAGLSTLHSIFKVMASLPEQPADHALAAMLRYSRSGR